MPKRNGICGMMETMVCVGGGEAMCWRASLAGERVCCSYREEEFGFQILCWAAHDHLKLLLQGI